MKHALDYSNNIVNVLEESEPTEIDLDIAILTSSYGIPDWVLVRGDMIFESEEAAKKHVFMARLKGKKK